MCPPKNLLFHFPQKCLISAESQHTTPSFPSNSWMSGNQKLLANCLFPVISWHSPWNSHWPGSAGSSVSSLAKFRTRMVQHQGGPGAGTWWGFIPSSGIRLKGHREWQPLQEAQRGWNRDRGQSWREVNPCITWKTSTNLFWGQKKMKACLHSEWGGLTWAQPWFAVGHVQQSSSQENAGVCTVALCALPGEGFGSIPFSYIKKISTDAIGF